MNQFLKKIQWCVENKGIIFWCIVLLLVIAGHMFLCEYLWELYGKESFLAYNLIAILIGTIFGPYLFKKFFVYVNKKVRGVDLSACCNSISWINTFLILFIPVADINKSFMEVTNYIKVLCVLYIPMFIHIFVMKLVINYLKYNKCKIYSRMRIEFMKFCDFSIGAICFLLGISLLGFNVLYVLTLGGAFASIIAYVVKEFYRGFMIFFERTFWINDYVRLINSHRIVVQGTVKEITWQVTTIKNDEGIVVSVPNSQVASMFVENHSRKIEGELKRIVSEHNKVKDSVE